MKKVIVADRLNIFIQTVFSEFDQHDGGVTALAMVLYTCQLYMDFSGTMDCVLGTAEIFGIRLPENFKRPFFSKSISDFWTRWHITLGTWFRDYIFYPVSMSKPLKRLTVSARKRLGNHFGPLLAGAIALFCVWIVTAFGTAQAEIHFLRHVSFRVHFCCKYIRTGYKSLRGQIAY